METSETTSQANQRYLSNLEEHKKATKEAIRYSIERFDILIISLSSGGLLLSITIVKDILGSLATIDPTFLKLSWLFFGLTLILNLLSQVTGYFANKYELQICTNLIRIRRGKAARGNQKNKERFKCLYDKATQWLNGSSIATFFTALVLLTVFIFRQIN